MKSHEVVSRSLCAAAMLSLALPLLGDAAAVGGTEPPHERDAVARMRMARAYAQLPLTFEANRGQTDRTVKFLVRGSGSALFLTSTEGVMVVTGRGTEAVVRMSLVGGNLAPDVEGIEQLAGTVNYFIGNDPVKWRTNVPTYAKVQYKRVYPGIDLVYYGSQRNLEYDFIVDPGADPGRIVLSFRGADRLELDAHGDLVLHTAVGAIHQRRPFIYQHVDGARQEVSGRYVLKGGHRVGFQIAAYDPSRPLVIDPGLFYSTLLGGSGSHGDAGSGIAVDGAGNAYVTGVATSSDFPTTSGVVQSIGSLFVTKLNPTGSGLVYSTHFGGSNPNIFDFGKGIAVDSAGNAYVAGVTGSSDYPTTPGAFQPVAPAMLTASPCCNTVGFVTKLNPSGSSLVYSTYLAGNNTGSQVTGIAVDSAGSAYISGTAFGSDYPTTSGAFQPTRIGRLAAFVTKLDPTGSSLVYSTFLGGSQTASAVADTQGAAIAVDNTGSAYITGQTNASNFPTTPGAFQTSTSNNPGTNAFVTKLNPTGSALVYSTYVAGGPVPGGGTVTIGTGIALDPAGHAYVMGITEATDFPTTPGAFQTVFGGGCTDIFVTEVDTTGSTLLYSTFLGGNGCDGSENAGGIAVDPSGNAYVGNTTVSTNFPTTAGAFQTALAGRNDATFTMFAPGGSLVYSSHLGGSGGTSGIGIAVDTAGNAYVTGVTDSADFPTSPGAFQARLGGPGNAFVARFSPNDTPTGSNVGVLAIPGVTVTFASVTSTGNTTAAASSTGPTPPAGFSLGSSRYYSVTTTAVFGAPATVCISYDPTLFNDLTTLRIFHFENNAWVDVTTSNDPINGKICGQTSSLSPFLIAERTPIPVTIAIKPMAAAPVPVNLGSSIVPVAILGSSTFDASSVDPSTVTLASAPVKLKGNGSPTASLQDVNGDRVADLVVQVQTSALQLSSSSTTAVLKGRTFSGLPIKGSEAIVVVPQ